jgi:hypothetical protein
MNRKFPVFRAALRTMTDALAAVSLVSLTKMRVKPRPSGR